MKAPVTRILHPTDFSESCEQALEYARYLHEVTGADVHLLHVVTAHEDVRMREDDLRDACAAAEQKLAKLAAKVGKGAVTAVRIGRPHVAVKAYVDAEKIDLVVMGTVGMSAAEGVGSIAEKVIRAVSVPVLTVKAAPVARKRVCMICGQSSEESICGACSDRVRAEAVHRRPFV